MLNRLLALLDGEYALIAKLQKKTHAKKKKTIENIGKKEYRYSFQGRKISKQTETQKTEGKEWKSRNANSARSVQIPYRLCTVFDCQGRKRKKTHGKQKTTKEKKVSAQIDIPYEFRGDSRQFHAGWG